MSGKMMCLGFPEMNEPEKKALKVVRPPTAREIREANMRNAAKAAYAQEEAKRYAPESGNVATEIKLTRAAIVSWVRFFFYTILGVSISAALFFYLHQNFWASFFIGLGIGTVAFLLGWIFWGLCLAGVLCMFGAVHFATLVLLLIVLGIACKMVTAGLKAVIIDAIRESKKDTGT